MAREQKHDLLALAERAKARPSLLMSFFAGFGVWMLAGLAGHLICDWTDASERAREVFNDIALFIAIIAVWHVRYEPVADLIAKAKGGAS